MHKEPLWDEDLQIMSLQDAPEQKLVLYFNSQQQIFRLIYHTADQTTTAKLVLMGGDLHAVEMAPI